MKPPRSPRIALRRAVLRLPPYQPPVEGRAGRIRLDFNENTVGCSPAVLRALSRVSPEQLAMYPEYHAATSRLARHFRVPPSMLLLSNGVDDALRILVDTFVEPRSHVLIAEPTFDMYRFYAELAGARVVAEHFDAEMRFPLARILSALRRSPRILFLANPNNPTGTLLQRSDLRRILRAATRTLVVLDEAYFEYSGVSVLPWVRRSGNLVVLRTFSKAAGLAGLRLGCVFARAEHIEAMQRASSPFPVNAAALIAAEAALGDAKFTCRYVREVLASREELARGLARLGVKTYPSATNFILADFGPRAGRIVRALKRQGILIRERGDFSRPGFVRITAGTRQHTRRLLRALEALL